MKIVAFYLPQFHTFPENDEWWGKGFTEWTNTKKGKPLFKNHYQPHTPLNQDYYDLVLDKSVFARQIKMAKDYGVDAFCYYHYWFANGKKLMEKPIERMLADKSLDMPFCLCWANENWSRRWDGSEESILMSQDYGDKQGWINHFNYLLDYFRDNRYLKDHIGRPILLIYKPQLISALDEMMTCWRKLAVDAGFPGICLVCQYPQYGNGIEKKFDNYVEFEPAATTGIPGEDFKRAWKIAPKYALEVGLVKLMQATKVRSYKKYNYRDAVMASIRRPMRNSKEWLGAFTGWDNTARRGRNAIVYHNSTPELFENYVVAQLRKSKQAGQEGILFINAWNEWAEGAHLEPDERFGMKYLEALKKAKGRVNEE